MTTVTHKGTVTIVAFVNQRINDETPNPQVDVTQQMENTFISWDSSNATLPLTISSLSSNKQWAPGTKMTTSYTVSGTQDVSSYYGNIHLYMSGKNVLTSVNANYNTTIRVPYKESNFSDPFSEGPIVITYIPGNSNFQVPTYIRASADDGDVNNLNVTFVIDIVASIVCSGQNLQSSSCISYCTDNPTACLQSYVEYCQPAVLEIAPVCQNFITNYLAKNGPSKQVDDVLQTYCTSKYKNLESLFDTKNGATEQEQDICACHMQDSEYAAIQDRITVEFPQISSFYSQVPRCMLPQCVRSSYPSLPMPVGGCKIPECLQISVFDVNGVFSGNSVNVTQTCTKENGDNTINVIVMILVILLIILIIYLLY